MEVYESVVMTDYVNPQWAWCGENQTKSGVVIEETKREEAGLGMEPSGNWFMNYRDVSIFTFHPYDGSEPIPCKRPHGYRTYRR